MRNRTRTNVGRHILALVSAAIFCVLYRPLSAEADTEGALAFLQQRHEGVRAILQTRASDPRALAQRNERLTEALNALLDYEELAKRALDAHWPTLREDQRAEFVRLLSELVERNYTRSLESTLDVKVRYVNETPGAGGSSIVHTYARPTKSGRAPEIAIDYTLVPRGGAWKVYDVTTDGVSLVANYRSQFNRIIEQQGFSAVLERMRQRIHAGDDAL